jgi:hypothetical protein
MRRILICLALLLCAASARAQAPVLFFSDLISGPATGNSDTTYSTGGGAYVTIYGNFLGSSMTSSSVALNGSNCLGIVLQPSAWMWYQKFTVQLHSGCTTGNFTVTTGSGTSNGIAFTVQSENIYFASGSGSDSAAGSFSAPWRTLTHARSTMPAGSITYAQTGSDATTDDGTGWSTTMLITQNGTAAAPYAIIGYPGETVQIGPNSGGDSAIRSGDTIPANYWTFAELNVHAVSGEAVAQWGSNYWRWIGDDMTAPQANGEEGGAEPIDSTYTTFYGNNIHNMGITGAEAEFHGLYIATDVSETDVGWNTIAYTNGGRCLQTHSEYNGPGTNGFGIYNINIHDNVIHDCALDCMVGDSLSPNGNGSSNPQGGPLSGPVTIYNNVMYNCGQTTPPEDTGTWMGLYLTGVTTTGAAPSGTIYAFNNTIYAFGVNTSPPYGSSEYGIDFGGSSPILAISNNNLLYSTQGTRVPYFGGGSSFTGSHNWMYNGPATSGVATITGTIGTNPNLTNVTSYNFTPLSGSPVLGAGTAMGGVITPFGPNTIGQDINGIPRPASPAIGAIELTSSTPQASPPSCTPGTGTYASAQTVTCTNPNSGTTVMCYTTNGTAPATNGSGTGCTTGTQYTTTISVASTLNLKVIAGVSGDTDSMVASYNYTISPTVSAPATVIFAARYTLSAIAVLH